MSVLTASPAAASTSVLQWNLADDGFWVATRDGAFAGTIDQHSSGYVVRDQIGAYLGTFTTAAAARAHLARTSR